MASPGSGSRRRGSTRTYSAEDQALDQIAREAEARLAARRQARAEARDIRMRELDKQQRETEEKQDRHFELVANMRTYSSSVSTGSRRGSDDSTEDTRELKKEVQELEDKYKKSMMNSAQLDNEKQTYRYQVDLLKDQIEESEETHIELQRQYKDKSRNFEYEKRKTKDLQQENSFYKEQIEHRDRLIEEHGLVFVSDDQTPSNSKNNNKKQETQVDGPTTKLTNGATTAALLTPEAVDILEEIGDGTLDEKIKKFGEEKSNYLEEVKKLKQQLEEERERSALAEKYSTPKLTKVNGPDMVMLDMQRDAQKQLSDYKFKLKKAEQDITVLEGSVIRLESQAKRYKTAADNSEKLEEELKKEKRNLQRELREAQSEMEELQTQNNHLQKRLEKIKSARSVLGKP